MAVLLEWTEIGLNPSSTGAQSQPEAAHGIVGTQRLQGSSALSRLCKNLTIEYR